MTREIEEKIQNYERYEVEKKVERIKHEEEEQLTNKGTRWKKKLRKEWRI